jgi:hypothetical protein
MSEDVDRQHRSFGAQAFNKTWTLIDKPDRSVEENLAMLLTAAASRWHWDTVGGPEQLTVGDWQVAHVTSLLGMAELALPFAERSPRVTLAQGWDGWRPTSAHEGMARALTAVGDGAGREHHLALAAPRSSASPTPRIGA